MSGVSGSYESTSGGFSPYEANTCEAPPPESLVCTADDAPVSSPDGPGAPPERAGSATIVCNGAGGYGVQLNSWQGAPDGVEACVSQHEQSHATDWAGRWPDGCKNADGTAKPAGTAVPTGGPGYADFLKRSECRAYTGEVPCEETALRNAPAADKAYVQGVLDQSKQLKTNYCP